MDILSITLHLYMIYICVERISGVIENLRVRQGQNITLYCEFKVENTFEIGWRRNCSHVNQPPLTLEGKWIPPRFTLLWNTSSNSVDLMIENITEHDLGLYYCRNANTNQERKIVKILLEEPPPSPQPSCPPSPDCGQCWMLLIVLCPVCSLISALISSICTYYFFHNKEPKKMEFYPSTTNRKDRSRKQDGDLCYASLDFPPGGHKPRPKKKTRQNNDLSTYSDIRTGTELR
ncbi:uncharacterized protein LOC121680961 [Alosa sapidissima]|uniref:uncharacterized protein LOC121680961 n=1 Tax=Alosa sapidissima TaxID=34773 RepID=UPI001C092461|nr:uncharacterized protein LOC121680961 [Alosa sapidissima]